MAGKRARIAVFGSGLIGVFLGGRLAPFADVVLIGRASVLNPLRDGLRLTDLDGLDQKLKGTEFSRSESPDALAGADLVLVTVKSLGTDEAAAAMAAHAAGSAPILSFQNGVDNAARLRALLPGRTVLAGMVPFNVAARAPDHYHRGTGGALSVEQDPALAPFAPLFEAAGLPLNQSDNMAGVQWGKLLVNLNNAINALSGVSLLQQLMQRDFRRAWALAMDEGLRATKRARIALVDPLPMPLALMPQILRLPDPLYRFVTSAGTAGRVTVDPHARSSLADDLVKGRRTEVDQINGAVVDLAQAHGLKAPVNRRIVELVRLAEAGAPACAAPALLADLRAARRSLSRNV